ncbi:hypothetical protein [Streptomyces sp. NPDC001833]|uniref:hypothetical protein n=1 Tax=Streptomyces sp. NPDC001833 TaxID=3154658 RepID=UPI00332671F3
MTPTDNAAAVGVHESAMPRYFGTWEPIFPSRTAEGRQNWSAALRSGQAETVALGEVVSPATVLKGLLGITESVAADVVVTATSTAGALWQMAAPRHPAPWTPRVAPRAGDAGPPRHHAVTWRAGGPVGSG